MTAQTIGNPALYCLQQVIYNHVNTRYSELEEKETWTLTGTFVLPCGQVALLHKVPLTTNTSRQHRFPHQEQVRPQDQSRRHFHPRGVLAPVLRWNRSRDLYRALPGLRLLRATEGQRHLPRTQRLFHNHYRGSGFRRRMCYAVAEQQGQRDREKHHRL